MHDRTLAKVSLVMAAAGLLGLLATGMLIVPPSVGAGEITWNSVGQIVRLGGVIDSYSEKDGHLFLTVADNTGSIRAVVWNSIARNLPDDLFLGKGSHVTLTGQVANYRGDLEIVISRIEK